MAVDCLLSSLAQDGGASSAGPAIKLVQLGVLQSDHVSAVAGYEELSAAWGRTLCMPMEGKLMSWAPCCLMMRLQRSVMSVILALMTT